MTALPVTLPPPHPPPVVDLRSDNDSITSMDETAAAPSSSGRDSASRPNEIAIGESSRMPSSSRPEPIPNRDDALHSGIWLPIDYSHDPKNTVICKGWRAAVLELDYCKVAKDLYALPPEYNLVIPAEGSRVIDCPRGHIAVYAHHFEYGLRFPLDLVLAKILQAFNICLAQLTPLTMRNIIAYVWVCRDLDFPETLYLFRRLHWLRQNDSAEKG